MSKNDGKKKIADTYAELVTAIPLEQLDEEKATLAAREMNHFGLECNLFIDRKLKTAEPAELRSLLKVVQHLDHPEIGEGLASVVVDRVVPLDLKVEFFEVMAQLGESVDSEFLQQMQEADELYFQVSSYVNRNDAALAQKSSLVDQFRSLTKTLKLSFLDQINTELGEKALSFLLMVAEADDETAMMLIDLIAKYETEESARILLQIAKSSSNKEAVKKAKKAAYVLKEKGIEIDDVPEPEEVIVRDEKEEGEEAYATSFDSFGSRLLVLAQPALNRFLVCKASVDEKKGLLHFSATEMPRKALRDFLREMRDQIREQGVHTVAEIDAVHCRYLIQQAHDVNVANSTLIPEAYKRIKYRIKADENYDPQAFYTAQVPVTDDDLLRLRNIEEKLFAIQEISLWMVERDKLMVYTQRYMQMAETDIVLEEPAPKARLDEIVDGFADEYFDAEKVEKVQKRLLEMAYLLKMRGKKDEATQAAAMSKSLQDETTWKGNAFLRTFMLRSIIGTIQALMAEERQKAEAKGK
jgi:hypothetical protein